MASCCSVLYTIPLNCLEVLSGLVTCLCGTIFRTSFALLSFSESSKDFLSLFLTSTIFKIARASSVALVSICIFVSANRSLKTYLAISEWSIWDCSCNSINFSIILGSLSIAASKSVSKLGYLVFNTSNIFCFCLDVARLPSPLI